MGESIQELIDKIGVCIDDEGEYDDVVEEVLEALDKKENKFDAVEPIFRLIEDYPHFNFGSPGPLVAFIEEFDGYEEKLIESLRRKPTEYAVWMVGRIIWASKGEEKAYYQKLLDEVLQYPNLDKEVAALIPKVM
jgi:hypothetical protein